MKITKEMIFDQFKDAEKKDLKSKKKTTSNRVEFLKTLKDDIQKNPKNFDLKNLSYCIYAAISLDSSVILKSCPLAKFFIFASTIMSAHSQ